MRGNKLNIWKHIDSAPKRDIIYLMDDSYNAYEPLVTLGKWCKDIDNGDHWVSLHDYQPFDPTKWAYTYDLIDAIPGY